MGDATESADLVQVAETQQAYEAELIALRLRASGIDAQVFDQSFKQEPLPNVRAFSVVRVMVPAAQEQAAKKALSEGKSLPEGAEEGEDE